jgi:hypothetical protein
MITIAAIQYKHDATLIEITFCTSLQIMASGTDEALHCTGAVLSGN